MRRRRSTTSPITQPGRKLSCKSLLVVWSSHLSTCLTVLLCHSKHILRWSRVLCRAMMMTACDLSAITKPWEVQSKVRSRHQACHPIDSTSVVILLLVLLLPGCSHGGSRILGAGRPWKDSSWAAANCKRFRAWHQAWCLYSCVMGQSRTVIVISHFLFSRWWTEITPLNFPRCSAASSTLSAPLCTRYQDEHDQFLRCIFFLRFSGCLYPPRPTNLHVCRSLPVSTQRSNPCLMGWTTTGESGRLSPTSTKLRWRRSKMRRRVELHKVRAKFGITRLLLMVAASLLLSHSLTHLFVLQNKMEESRRRALSARPLAPPLTGSYNCLYVCLYAVYLHVCTAQWQNNVVQNS